jgi:23S rRNA (cytidine1920-2'-O)/16S rRNA (cytidine1409-2'-O)-methyltransferase
VRPAAKAPLAALLVARAYFSSVEEARRWVMAGQVLVNDRVVDKPGTPTPADAPIRIRGRRRFASRGGDKLAAALAAFRLPVAGRVALDCGASTGGFTDCLLQHGAALVYAVEAGYGQLLGQLRADARVRNLERTNLGDLTPATLAPRPSLVTLDLSYLSLVDALPLVSPLLTDTGDVLTLFKPLFEVGDAQVRRTGQLEQPALVVAALARVLDAGRSLGLQPRGAVKLALRPRHGVHEYVLHFARPAAAASWRYDPPALAAIVDSPGVGSEDES